MLLIKILSGFSFLISIVFIPVFFMEKNTCSKLSKEMNVKTNYSFSNGCIIDINNTNRINKKNVFINIFK